MALCSAGLNDRAWSATLGGGGQGLRGNRHLIEGEGLVVYLQSNQFAQPEAAMNVKISIELPESQLEFAERKVREGAYASVSEVIAESMRDTMLAEHERGDDPVMAMKDEIRRRLELPDDQWLSEEEFEQHFDKLMRYADEQIKAGR
jgi:antitoxin ParD1/3/4